MGIFLVVLTTSRFCGDVLFHYLYWNTYYLSDFSYSSLSITPQTSAIFYSLIIEKKCR